MKLKIKLKLFDKDCMPEIHGDWIDLKSAIGFSMCDKRIKKVSLGVAMQLPDGYEAVIVPRSGTFKKYSMLLVNSEGVMDNTYCGNEDIWKAQFIYIQEKKDWDDKKYDDTEYNEKWKKNEYGEFVDIPIYARLVQFRVQLSQHATMWQKIKNLFYSGVEFEIVDNLTKPNRGGFGHTGV